MDEHKITKTIYKYICPALRNGILSRTVEECSIPQFMLKFKKGNYKCPVCKRKAVYIGKTGDKP